MTVGKGPSGDSLGSGIPVGSFKLVEGVRNIFRQEPVPFPEKLFLLSGMDGIRFDIAGGLCNKGVDSVRAAMKPGFSQQVAPAGFQALAVAENLLNFSAGMLDRGSPAGDGFGFDGVTVLEFQ